MTVRKIPRSAKSGRFISRANAKRHPATTVIETIKFPGKRRKRG